MRSEAMVFHCDEDEGTEAALHPTDELAGRHWWRHDER